jgi:hypothetical protein
MTLVGQAILSPADPNSNPASNPNEGCVYTSEAGRRLCMIPTEGPVRHLIRAITTARNQVHSRKKITNQGESEIT